MSCTRTGKNESELQPGMVSWELSPNNSNVEACARESAFQDKERVCHRTILITYRCWFPGEERDER